jgi:hypothetical protein
LNSNELTPPGGKHRVHVEEALKAGKPVPARVLADYPDLRLQVKKAHPDYLGGAMPLTQATADAFNKAQEAYYAKRKAF